MANQNTVLDFLRQQGVSRRGFLKYCATTASLLALPPSMAPAIAKALGQAQRPSVIWLSFQECTGCTESLTRAHAPTLESLIFDAISLDYHHTLQAASGDAAEKARHEAMEAFKDRYILVVDGSIPTKDNGLYSTIAGISNLAMLEETAAHAAAIVSVGTCAAFGGLPMAEPNPTGAVPVSTLIQDKPIINVPGCPPIPIVISAVVAHLLTFGTVPALDKLSRPKAFYGNTIHDRCYRRTYYDQGKFAETFDDFGARNGWCLFKLGCKGPTTYNACASERWNNGTSFPIQSGHGCIGCSEPNFWDAGSFYSPLSASPNPIGKAATAGLVAGALLGGSMALANHQNKSCAREEHRNVGLEDLEK